MKNIVKIAALSAFISSCGDLKHNFPGSSEGELIENSSVLGSSAYLSDKDQMNLAESFQEAIIAVTASHYQSCAPLLNPGKKPKSIIRDFFEEKESYTRNKYCRDRRDANLDYVSFSKGSFEPNAGRLSSKNGKVDSMQRFNCSGFLAATMSAGGHKYYKSQDSKFYSPRTADLVKDFKRKDSCFYRPELSPKKSILPGDVINVSHGHVIRILSVGDDPLGLAKIRKKSQCGDISKKRFDFTFAHSTSNDKTPGFNGVLVEEGRHASTNIVKKLEKYTIELCKKKFKNGTFKGEIKDKEIESDEKGFWPFTSSQDKVFSLRRHVGSSKDSCVFKPVQVIGERCLETACYQKVSSN